MVPEELWIIPPGPVAVMDVGVRGLLLIPLELDVVTGDIGTAGPGKLILMELVLVVRGVVVVAVGRAQPNKVAECIRG